MKKHDFFNFMAQVKETLAKEYNEIRKRAMEDPGTAGDQVEESWAQFLRNWIPATYPVVTKGRILFADGTASPQVDILILSPSYPIELRNKKYYFAGGVVAVLECKLTLQGRHIRDAFQTAADIKRRMPAREGNPYDELFQVPYYCLIAHSHSWRHKHPSWKIHEKIEEYQVEFSEHPREQLDMICVASAGTFVLGKSIYVGRGIDTDIRKELRDMGMRAAVTSMYVIADEISPSGMLDTTGNILAEFVFALTSLMAFEDSAIRRWADHLAHLGFYGGIGRPIYWDTAVLSKNVRQKIARNALSDEAWSKWSRYLP